MAKNNISQTIRRVIAQECGLKLKSVSRKTDFMTSTGPEYYDCMGALYTLQHIFHVDLPECKYERYNTVGGLTRDIINQLKHNHVK